MRCSRLLFAERPRVYLSPLVAELFEGVYPHVQAVAPGESSTDRAVEMLFSRNDAPLHVFKSSRSSEMLRAGSNFTIAKLRQHLYQQRRTDRYRGRRVQTSAEKTFVPKVLADPIGTLGIGASEAWRDALKGKPPRDRAMWQRLAARASHLADSKTSRLLNVVALLDGQMAAMIVWSWWRHYRDRRLWPRANELMLSPLAYQGLAIAATHAPALLRPWMELIEAGSKANEECRRAWTTPLFSAGALPFHAWVVAVAVIEHALGASPRAKIIKSNSGRRTRLSYPPLLTASGRVEDICSRLRSVFAVAAPEAVPCSADLVAVILPLLLDGNAASRSSSSSVHAPLGFRFDVWRSLWLRFFSDKWRIHRRRQCEEAGELITHVKDHVRASLDAQRREAGRLTPMTLLGDHNGRVKELSFRKDFNVAVKKSVAEQEQILRDVAVITDTLSPGTRLRAAMGSVPPAASTFMLNIVSFYVAQSTSHEIARDAMHLATDIVKQSVASLFTWYDGAAQLAAFADAEMPPNAPHKPHIGLLMSLLTIGASVGDLRVCEALVNDVIPVTKVRLSHLVMLLVIALSRRIYRRNENSVACPALGDCRTTEGVVAGICFAMQVSEDLKESWHEARADMFAAGLVHGFALAARDTKLDEAVRCIQFANAALRGESSRPSAASDVYRQIRSSATMGMPVPPPSPDTAPDLYPLPLVALCEIVHQTQSAAHASYVIGALVPLVTASAFRSLRRQSRVDESAGDGEFLERCFELIHNALRLYMLPAWRKDAQFPRVVAQDLAALTQVSLWPAQTICLASGWLHGSNKSSPEAFPWLCQYLSCPTALKHFSMGLLRALIEGEEDHRDLVLAIYEHFVTLLTAQSSPLILRSTSTIPVVARLLRAAPARTGLEYNVTAPPRIMWAALRQAGGGSAGEEERCGADLLPSLGQQGVALMARHAAAVVSDESLWSENAVRGRQRQELGLAQRHRVDRIRTVGFDFLALGKAHSTRIMLSGALARPLHIAGGMPPGATFVVGDGSTLPRDVTRHT